jgi:hypothetical protein
VNSIKHLSKSEISRRRLKVQVSNPEEAAQPPVPNSPSEDVAMEDARQCESPEITKEKDDDEKDLGEVEDGESEEAVPASPTFVKGSTLRMMMVRRFGNRTATPMWFMMVPTVNMTKKAALMMMMTE